MKLNLKPFAVAAAVLAATAARAGSTCDPITGELRHGRPSTEALGHGALVVEPTDVTSEQVAGSGSGEPQVGTQQTQEQQDEEFLHGIWTMP